MFMNKISMSQTCMYNFFLQKSYQIFTTTSRYRRHSAVVWYNSKFATVHSRVTVGGCSMDFEYNFLCQFARAVAHTMLYISVLDSICTASLQGHTKRFWKKNFSSFLFLNLLGTSIQEPCSHCCSVLFWDMSKNASCGPVVSCSGSV